MTLILIIAGILGLFLANKYLNSQETQLQDLIKLKDWEPKKVRIADTLVKVPCKTILPDVHLGQVEGFKYRSKELKRLWLDNLNDKPKKYRVIKPLVLDEVEFNEELGKFGKGI